MQISTFSKEKTQLLKGIGILMMLFLHLFNGINIHLGNSTPLLYISKTPLLNILAKASNPVYFYLFLSGYGLFISFINNKSFNLKKLSSLYIHYWLSLLFFLPICIILIGGDKYPGSPISVLMNLTGLNTTWNGTIWFLLPYIILSYFSKYIFYYLKKSYTHEIIVIVSSFIVFLFAIFSLHLYGDYLIEHPFYYLIEHLLELQFPLCLGALSAKRINYTKIHCFFSNKKTLLFIIIFLLVFIRCFCFQKFIVIIHPFYISALIICLSLIDWPKIVKLFLSEMGKRSTSMWFIHYYYCHILFADFIYGFKYSFIIFPVLIIISYITSLFLDKLMSYTSL